MSSTILKNENTSRIYWKLAKVENLLRSKDNVVRSAEVRVLSEVKDTSEVKDSSEVQDSGEVQDTSGETRM